MRKKKKKQGLGWSPIRFKSTWRDYRYGEKRKPTLPQIFTGKHRENAVQGVLIHLRDWRMTPFEHEGESRAGVRSALCLSGHSWAASDAEAASLVAEGLHRLGAKRPDWDEGQWHYALPRENCARCMGPISEEDQALGFRFCSDICAQATRVTWFDQIPPNHEMRVTAYWQVAIANAPVFTCKECGKKFKVKMGPKEIEANPPKYCSYRCHDDARRLPMRNCLWCQKPFKPAGDSKRCCSLACSTQIGKRTRQRAYPDVTCPICHSIFRKRSPLGKYCSAACKSVADNAARKLPERTGYCEECGGAFIRKRSDRRWCSISCRSKTKWRQEKEARASAFFCEAAE